MNRVFSCEICDGSAQEAVHKMMVATLLLKSSVIILVLGFFIRHWTGCTGQEEACPYYQHRE